MLSLYTPSAYAQDAEAPVVEPPAPVEEASVEDLEIETIEEAVETGIELHTEIQEGDWTAAIALGLALIVFLVRKFIWTSIPGKALPWVTIGLAIAGEVAVALYSGMDPLTAVLSGIALGLAGIGGWEALKSLGVWKKPEAK